MTIMPALEELGIGFVPFSPLGKGFLDRQDRRDDDVRPRRLPQPRPRFTPKTRAKPTARLSIVWPPLPAKEGHPGADRARLAAGAEAVDRSDPGHEKTGAARRELGFAFRPTQRRGRSRNRSRLHGIQSARRTLPRRIHEAVWPLMDEPRPIPAQLGALSISRAPGCAAGGVVLEFPAWRRQTHQRDEGSTFA